MSKDERDRMRSLWAKARETGYKLWGGGWDKGYPTYHYDTAAHEWDTCFAYEYRKRWSEG
jgi:hypothetical protein